MVKFHNTVVASAAVRRTCRSEDVAALAELEFEQQRRVHQIDLQVVNALFTAHFQVLVVQKALDRAPTSRWNDARLSRTSVNHKEIGHKK